MDAVLFDSGVPHQIQYGKYGVVAAFKIVSLKGRVRISLLTPLFMVKEIDVAWFAGLMEGEGSFVIKEGIYPILSMTLTDLDVLEKVKDLFGGHIYRHTSRAQHHKPAWSWRLQGPVINVMQLMQRLLPYMGKRRSNKINECLTSGQQLLRERETRAHHVRSLRDQARLLANSHTQQEIADQLGCDRSYISRILSGQYL